MACKDPAVERLNDLGYNMVKLPRAGIEPLDVLGRDGKALNHLGSLSEVWSSAEPAPVAGAPQPAASVEGSRTSSLDINIGLKLLSSALAGLGSAIGLPSLALGFKRAKRIQFEFNNVVSCAVTPFGLGRYLATGTLQTSNPIVSRYFDDGETDEFILVEVLKSNTISVTTTDERGASVDADISALQGTLSSQVSAKLNGSSASSLIFTGTTQATFAFKAYEAIWEGAKWTLKGAPASDSLSFAAVAGEGNPVAPPAPGVVLARGRGVTIGLGGMRR